MPIPFTKMHGIGNDYVYVNTFETPIPDPAALARVVSDRHTGVGSDGLILIGPSDKADARMRMFNADGSESEMCGNGVRCVAKYVFDHGISKNNPLAIETGRGVLQLQIAARNNLAELVTVDMGEPILDLPRIPATMDLDGRKVLSKAGDWRYKLISPGPLGSLQAVLVSMGNPHAVFLVDDLARVELDRVGPMVENFAAFPKRINAHWVQVLSPSQVRMVTWERGSGPTRACGTGACAVAVACRLLGKTHGKVTAQLPGGDLSLDWGGLGKSVFMTGPAVEVFQGVWP